MWGVNWMYHISSRISALVALSLLLISLAVPLLLLSGKMQLPIHEANWREVRTITDSAGKDLDEYDREQMSSLITALSRLDNVEREKEPIIFAFRPQRVWLSTVHREGFTVLETEFGLPHPSAPGIRLTSFTHTGFVHAHSEFTSGWRCYPRTAELRRVNEIAEPLVVVNTFPFGPNIYREYYAIVEDRFDLIRLENDHGDSVRNRYYVRHFQCGPGVPKQSEEQWEAELRGEDRVKVLRALLWLGGHHIKSVRPDTLDNHRQQMEDMTQADLVHRIRARPLVIKRLQELKEKGDSWEQEMAEQCLKPEDIENF
jgi:hypothetical protein